MLLNVVVVVLLSLVLSIDLVMHLVHMLADCVVALDLRWVMECLSSASDLLAIVERNKFVVVSVESGVFK